MAKISCGDRRTKRWCDFVKQYNFNEIEIRDKYVKELIANSTEDDVKNVRAVAMKIRKKNTL